jgi:hypothetical protein
MIGMFAPGDRVRVADLHPPGHRRTPYYVRGKTGIVERSCQPGLNPEELGYGFSGEPKRGLYRVRFAQTDLWADYAGPPEDTVDVDLYEHWLSKAD